MIRDALLFITPNTKYPDESAGTVWNVTVQVFLELADPWEAGTLRLEVATKNGSAFIEKYLILKEKEEVISLTVNVPVSGTDMLRKIIVICRAHSSMLNFGSRETKLNYGGQMDMETSHCIE